MCRGKCRKYPAAQKNNKKVCSINTKDNNSVQKCSFNDERILKFHIMGLFIANSACLSRQHALALMF